MGILHNGLAGNYTGKLGNTVAYTLRNKSVIRMIGKSKKPPTEKKLANWQAMTVTNQFLKPIKAFIDVGFRLAVKFTDMYPYNKAVSYNKTNALKGIYPDIEMDYEKALISMGDLLGLIDPSAELQENGLKFTWDTQEWMSWIAANDQVMLMAYFPELITDDTDFQKVYFTLSGARRRKGHDFLELPPELTGQRMELYISVISDDRMKISNSQYLGRLN